VDKKLSKAVNCRIINKNQKDKSPKFGFARLRFRRRQRAMADRNATAGKFGFDWVCFE